MKYKEWLDVWFENYVKPSCKIRTVDSYDCIIRKRIVVALGEKEIKNITALDVQTFVTGLSVNGNEKTKGGLAASSVNTIITVIQSSLKAAKVLGYVPENVADGVKRPKIKGKKIICFTLTEQRRIERAILADSRSKMFGVVFCLYTGVRIGELLALTWDDIDLSKGRVFITKACHDGKTESGFGRITDEPKTESSKRIIPLPKQLVPHLKRLKNSEKSEYLISFNGRPITIRSYQKSFSLFLKKQKIPHKGFHSLRHTFATRALECGMDVKTLSEILGHKSATVTLNRYVHSLMEHKQDMMNRLGKTFAETYEK